MKRLAIRLGIVGVILAVGAITGLRSDKVREYNDLVVDLYVQSENEFTDYLTFLSNWYDGQTVDVAALHKELDRLGQAHQDARQKLSSVKVPDHEECRKLQSSLMDYVSVDTEIIAAYHTIADYIDQHNPGSELDFSYVSGLVDPLAERQNHILDRIQADQRAMAKKFDFELR